MAMLCLAACHVKPQQVHRIYHVCFHMVIFGWKGRTLHLIHRHTFTKIKLKLGSGGFRNQIKCEWRKLHEVVTHFKDIYCCIKANCHQFFEDIRPYRLWQGELQNSVCSLTASTKIHFSLRALFLTPLSVTNYFVCTLKEISQDCQQHWSCFSLPDVHFVHLLTLALHNMKNNWRWWGDTAINLVNYFPFANETISWVHNLHN